MKIEIWSDFMCPYCYMGQISLKEALNELKINADIELRTFELRPGMESRGEKMLKAIQEKYGMSEYQLKATANKMEKMAKEVGLDYDMDNAISANTKLAHRYVKFADKKNLAVELELSLMKAVFIEGKDVGDQNFLLSKIKELDLDQKEAKEFVDSDASEALILEDEEMARVLSIEVIPTFRINEGEIIRGSLSKDEWVEILKNY